MHIFLPHSHFRAHRQSHWQDCIFVPEASPDKLEYVPVDLCGLLLRISIDKHIAADLLVTCASHGVPIPQAKLDNFVKDPTRVLENVRRHIAPIADVARTQASIMDIVLRHVKRISPKTVPEKESKVQAGGRCMVSRCHQLPEMMMDKIYFRVGPFNASTTRSLILRVLDRGSIAVFVSVATTTRL